MNRLILLAFSLSLTSMTGWASPSTAETKIDGADQEENIFATVGDLVISRLEFEEVYQQAKRQKFYHGKPTEKDQEAFRRKTAEELIDRKLLLQEAMRRGIQPDEAKINAKLDQYQQRYANSKRWQKDGSKMLAALGGKLREDQLLQELGNQVRQNNQPDDTQLKDFYKNNLDKFTEPATQRVSLILLKVDPSSPKEVWEGAETEAAELQARIHKGEEFSALAVKHSADLTAQKGGDMGYLHKGMLGQAAETAVGKLSIGEISGPVRVLEGVAIFRLEDRKVPQLKPLSAVKTRAIALWQREKNEEAWQALKKHLRNTIEIKLYPASKTQA